MRFDGDTPADRATFARYYDDLADEIGSRERRLADELPDVAPYGLDEQLEAVADDWRAGRRTTRAVPAIAVYERLGVSIPADLRRALAGLDATVNALDDLIDDRNRSRERTVGLAAVVAFSDAFGIEHLPAAHAADVADVLYDYWVELAQIPRVERRLLERLRLALTDEERIGIARDAYAYRARDIDAFVRIPAVVRGVDDDVVGRLRADLRAFRARYLLFEDFRHVTRDLKEGHENPAMILLDLCDRRADVRSLVEAVRDEFAYSGVDGADLLRDLERRPDDLDRLIDRGAGALPYAAVG